MRFYNRVSSALSFESRNGMCTQRRANFPRYKGDQAQQIQFRIAPIKYIK
jgi:hypothetical protein